MTVDAELAAWREDWRAEARPLSDLKRKIRRHHLRTIVAAILVCVCLTLAMIAAFRKPSPFTAGLVTGLWFTAIFGGAYAWRVRRGAWKPSAQTALAYAELSYKTTVAKAKIIRLAFWLSIGASVLLISVIVWNRKDVPVSYEIILSVLVAEAAAFRHYGRRKEREITATKELLDYLKDPITGEAGERFSLQ